MNKTELEKIVFGAVINFSEEYLNDVTVNNQDLFDGFISCQIRGSLYKNITPEVDKEIKYPKNWRQHFKQDCFPKWLLKIFPVVYTVEKIKVSKIYPEFKHSQLGKTMFIVEQREFENTHSHERT